MTIDQIRTALRTRFGARKYRIKGNEIHAYGTMPNTNQDGWYLFGWIGDEQTEEILQPNQRGGARQGAGRKTVDGASGVVPVNISLTSEERDKLKALGGSAWVRAQLRNAE